MRPSLVLATLAWLASVTCVACGKSSSDAPVDAAPAVIETAATGEVTGIGSVPASMQFEAKVVMGDARPEMIERVVRSEGTFTACYRRAQGTVGDTTLDVKIGPNGKPAVISTVATTLDADLTSCLTSAMGGVSFPPAAPGFEFSGMIRFAGAHAEK